MSTKVLHDSSRHFTGKSFAKRPQTIFSESRRTRQEADVQSGHFDADAGGAEHFAICLDGNWQCIGQSGDGPAFDAQDIFVARCFRFLELPVAAANAHHERLEGSEGERPSRAALHADEAQERKIQAASGTPKVELSDAKRNRLGGSSFDDCAFDSFDCHLEWLDRMGEESLEPSAEVGDTSHSALLEAVRGVHHGGVNSHAGSDGEEPRFRAGRGIAGDFSERYRARCGLEQPACGIGWMMGNLKVLGENVSGSEGNDAQRDRGPGEALQDIEDRSIAATDHHGIEAAPGCLPGRLARGPLRLCFEDLDLDTGALKDFEDGAQIARAT